MELTTTQAPVEVCSQWYSSGVDRSEDLLKAFNVKVNPGFQDHILVPCTALLAPGITTLRCQATGDQNVSVLRVLQDAGYVDDRSLRMSESVVYDHVLILAAAGAIREQVWLFENSQGVLLMASLRQHPSLGGLIASAFAVDDATRILCPRLALVYMA